MDKQLAFDILHEIATNVGTRQYMVTNPLGILETKGIKDDKDVQDLMAIIQPLLIYFGVDKRVPDLQFSEMQQHYQALGKFRQGLCDTIDQMHEGYKRTMMMYTVSFYLGVFLILLSVVLAFFKGETLLSIVFGGLGIADVISFFITKPPQDLQNSRADLAELQTAYFSWYKSLMAWESYIIGKFNQQNMATDLAEALNVTTKSYFDNTERMMELIQKYAENKPTKRRNAKNKRDTDVEEK